MTPLRAQVSAVHLRAVAPHVLAPVAFDQPLDGEEQIGPHRLRAEIAAPDAAGDRVHQEQHDRRQDQQAGEVIDFLRPDLDEEEIEAAVGKIDQHRLLRRVRAAIPAHERQQIIDAEGDDQHHPFDAAEGAVHALRIDFPARRIERDVVVWAARRRLRPPLPVAPSPAPRAPAGRATECGRPSQSLLSAAEAIDVDGQRLDGRLAQAPLPGRHHAAAAVSACPA